MNPGYLKMLRWERFTARLRKKYPVRCACRPDAVCRSCTNLQSAIQRELFRWTKPLPQADHVIDAVERLMRNEHG